MSGSPPQVSSVSTAPTSKEVDWPKLSVVVPTHNRPQLLRETVRSILGQTYPGELELLVVFDREDPVPPDVPVPAHREMRLLRNDRTPGPAGCYNVGLLAATGEYVALCDDDDEWLPDKATLQVQAFRAHPESLFATCGVYLGDGTSARKLPSRVPDREVLSMDDLLTSARNALHSSTFMVPRQAILDRVGLVDEAIPGSYGEDYDWLVRAAKLAPVIAVTKPLVRVRWQFSYFADRWATIIEAIDYQLERRPELLQQPANLARLYGRLAFAHAALGHRREAREFARKSLRIDRRQPRPYLAYLVSWRVLKPQHVLKVAHRFGRGV